MMDEQESRDLTESQRKLAAELRAVRIASFGPGFVDRVMARVSEAPAPVIVLDSALRRQFRRLVPLAAAVMIGLAAHNLILRPAGVEQSTIEAALGLEPVTLDVAYAFEPTLYTSSSPVGGDEGARP
jgi:hypothetical protein